MDVHDSKLEELRKKMQQHFSFSGSAAQNTGQNPDAICPEREMPKSSSFEQNAPDETEKQIPAPTSETIYERDDKNKKNKESKKEQNIRLEDMPIRELCAHRTGSDDEDDDSDDGNPYLQLIPLSLRNDLQPKPGSGEAPVAARSAGAARAAGSSGASASGAESGAAPQPGVAKPSPELVGTLAEIEELLAVYRKGKKKTKRDEEDEQFMDKVKQLMNGEEAKVPANARPDKELLESTDELRKKLMAGSDLGEQGADVRDVTSEVKGISNSASSEKHDNQGRVESGLPECNRNDEFVKGMSETFHLDDEAIANRRRRLEEQRERMDKKEKLPPDQLRLEKLPNTFDVQWPSKQQLKTSLRQ